MSVLTFYPIMTLSQYQRAWERNGQLETQLFPAPLLTSCGQSLSPTSLESSPHQQACSSHQRDPRGEPGVGGQFLSCPDLLGSSRVYHWEAVLSGMEFTCFPFAPTSPICNAWSRAERILSLNMLLIVCHKMTAPFTAFLWRSLVCTLPIPQMT